MADEENAGEKPAMVAPSLERAHETAQAILDNEGNKDASDTDGQGKGNADGTGGDDSGKSKTGQGDFGSADGDDANKGDSGNSNNDGDNKGESGKGGGDGGNEGDGGQGDGTGQESGSGEGGGDGGNEDGSGGKGGGDSGSGEEGGRKEESRLTDPKSIEIPEIPELDTDIKKSIEGKVAVKNVEGETMFFNNINEVPDDFEPENAKQWGVAVLKLAENVQKRNENISEREEKVQEKNQATRAVEIQDGWRKEQEALAEDGLLPKNPEARQPIVDKVYKVIMDELAEGKPVGSWTQAFNIYEAGRMRAEAADKNKKKDDKKSEQGNKIQSGGTPSPKGTTKEEHESPPAGATLDSVHAKTMGSL